MTPGDREWSRQGRELKGSGETGGQVEDRDCERQSGNRRWNLSERGMDCNHGSGRSRRVAGVSWRDKETSGRGPEIGADWGILADRVLT